MNFTTDNDLIGTQPPFLSSSGNLSAPDESNLPSEDVNLSVPYVVCEVLVAVTAVIGNALTIVVFAIERKLRRLTNYYIVSLAIADFLVGMPGIPFAILTSIGIPHIKYICFPMLSLLIILCTVSIFCLVAVSVDRYWAILYPMRYSRVMTAKIARRIITLCWIAGTFIGMLPMMGWRREYDQTRGCIFPEIMSYNYLVFLYLGTIVVPGLIMAFFYAHIFTVVLKQTKLTVKSEHGTLRQIAAQEPHSEAGSIGPHSSNNSQKQRPHFLMSRSHSRSQVGTDGVKCDSRRTSTGTNIVLEMTHASRREVKAAKSLSIIVLFFMVCWFPLYTINCIQAFCPMCKFPPSVMFVTIILTHVNSAVNPFLYAYHMKDFRHALKSFILYRILRRQPHMDSVYGNRLVSPHHSTLYRVTVGGGGSPHLTHLHTPHTHNTPNTSSPLPAAGAPGGVIRSRSSTLGSYVPWVPSREVSPSTSLRKTSESEDEPSSRPRAATIASHTSPASAHSPSKEASSSTKPMLSATNLCSMADDFHGISQAQPKTTSSADAIMVNTIHTDPADVVINISEADIIPDTTKTPVDHLHAAPVLSTLEEERGSNSPSKPDNSSATSKAKDAACHQHLSNNTLENAERKGCNNNDSTRSTADTNNGSALNVLEERCSGENLTNVPCAEVQKLTNSNKYCSSTDANRCHEAIEDGSIEDIKSKGNLKLPHYLTMQDEHQNGVDPFLNEQEPLMAPQIPNGTDDITVLSTDNAAERILSSDSTETKNEKCIESNTNLCRSQEKNDESSFFHREFYKYLPKVLRRKDESKKYKSSRTGKGWFSSMMRHRSYHGVTQDVLGPNQQPRAQSISGSMET